MPIIGTIGAIQVPTSVQYISNANFTIPVGFMGVVKASANAGGQVFINSNLVMSAAHNTYQVLSGSSLLADAADALYVDSAAPTGSNAAFSDVTATHDSSVTHVFNVLAGVNVAASLNAYCYIELYQL